MENKYENNYRELVKRVISNNNFRDSRTGVKCYSSFGKKLEHNMCEGFPILTGKKMYLKNFIHELIWMINGETNISYLRNNNVNIWNEWADENGELGPVYGKQLRSFNGEVDQLKAVITNIKSDPYSRRHLLTMWNPLQLKDMALPPCHFSFQFYVSNNNELSVNAFMRSGDLFIGVPYDFCFYAALLIVASNQLGLTPGKVILNITDCHIYENHLQQCVEYINSNTHDLPTLNYSGDMFKLKYENFKLVNYNSEKLIKANIAV